MTKKILLIATFVAGLGAPAMAQLQTCVWPNRCSKSRIAARKAPVVRLAQLQTCVWPNRCAKTPKA